MGWPIKYSKLSVNAEKSTRGVFQTQSSNFQHALDNACSHLQLEPDWSSILLVCDIVRQKDVTAKQAIQSIKRKLQTINPHTTLFALIVLESLAKNCGAAIHDEFFTKENCDFLIELLRTTTHANVRNKILEMIQAWTHAFRFTNKYSVINDALTIIKSKGYLFPERMESDAMFLADSAPTWEYSKSCHSCNAWLWFNMRRHHCRNCGYTFCANCSANFATLPKFGYEKKVRVCNGCFNNLQKKKIENFSKVYQEISTNSNSLPLEYLNSALSKESQTSSSISDPRQEEEDFELALALSQSEMEYRMESDAISTTRPSAPLSNNIIPQPESKNEDATLESFSADLNNQIEVFMNRLRSMWSRGRTITPHDSLHTVFLNITTLHSQLMGFMQETEDKRSHLENLREKLSQITYARMAVDDLRGEYYETLYKIAKEKERAIQLQKIQIMETIRRDKLAFLQKQRFDTMRMFTDQNGNDPFQQRNGQLLGGQFDMDMDVSSVSGFYKNPHVDPNKCYGLSSEVDQNVSSLYPENKAHICVRSADLSSGIKSPEKTMEKKLGAATVFPEQGESTNHMVESVKIEEEDLIRFD